MRHDHRGTGTGRQRRQARADELRVLRHVQIQRTQRLQRIEDDQYQPGHRFQLLFQCRPRRGDGPAACCWTGSKERDGTTSIGQRQHVQPFRNRPQRVEAVVNFDGIVLGSHINRHAVTGQRTAKQDRRIEPRTIERRYLA